MSVVANHEAEILSRIIKPHKAGFSEEASRAILALAFDTEDLRRMNELSDKARAGTLTESEQGELDSYERVGHLLGIMQSKARLSLKGSESSPPNS